MFKRMVDQSKTWMFAGLLALSFWVVFSQPAQADKVMKSLVFDKASSTVEVVTTYETAYAAQKGVMKSLKINSKSMKKASGFKGFFMLKNPNGKEIITFSQWQDLASYQAYTPPNPALTADNKATTSVPAPPAPTRNLVFEVADIQTSISGTTPALRGKEAVVQVAQFTPKQPEAQPQILTRVEQMIPELLKQQPIPQSVLLLKELDSGKVALLTNWNCSALFEDVGKPVAIEPSNDLIALADSTQQFYNVVNIIPAEVKKAEDKN